MTAALSPVARALLAWLQERPAAGEGSLKAWGQTRRPQLTLTQVEARAAELVEANLVTREVKPDGRAVYRAVPVEVATEPGWIPRVGAEGSFFGIDRSPEPAPCARCDQLAEALLSWERLWGVNGTDLAAMEARVQEAERERDDTRAHLQTVGLDARLSDALLREVARAIGCDSTRRDVLLLAAHKLREERDEARAAERGLQRQDVASYVHAEEATARLAQVTAERDQLAAALAKAKAATSAPAEPALSALARLPVEQRRIVGLALQELSLEALGGALGAARAEAFAARPDLAPRLSENAAAVLEILSPDRGQTPREIGKRSGINQHSVHSALRSLEKRGLATNLTYGFWRKANP